ncbi:MAG TPA: GH1 family beta-glucosidase [Polyangiaceae bacterium]|nr:GH1 family beta-glucosidase [Polyangiaceae bacterium]
MDPIFATNRHPFPKGFVWGSATSAYQIEGATTEDGRGESIWDRFTRDRQNVEDGSNGDVACDHYHRWRDDVALMKSLGLGAYRFSIAWPRILPAGRGQINSKGLDFYSRLIDVLLANGIEPFVTLYHWDLPQTLQDEGGWVARSTAEAFVEYASVVSSRLGDRVRSWITHNEPWCASLLGYQSGRHAPGLKDWGSALAASHHLLLSHGWAVPIIRANSRASEVGITLNLGPAVPASPSAEDQDAARHFDGGFNRWFLDPLHRAEYPVDMVGDYEERGYLRGGLRVVKPGDLRAIATTTDFLGVNYYNRTVVRSDRIAEDANHPRTVLLAPESEWTDMGWEVYPEGLFHTLMRLREEYRVRKLYITENGASYSEGPNDSGRVADAKRQKFVGDHLVEAHRAIQAGVPLAGYFVWSLLDNFEWDRGYTQRFGITWVDYATQKRVAKDCAFWYRDVIQRNALGGQNGSP